MITRVLCQSNAFIHVKGEDFLHSAIKSYCRFCTQALSNRGNAAMRKKIFKIQSPILLILVMFSGNSHHVLKDKNSENIVTTLIQVQQHGKDKSLSVKALMCFELTTGLLY